VFFGHGGGVSSMSRRTECIAAKPRRSKRGTAGAFIAADADPNRDIR